MTKTTPIVNSVSLTKEIGVLKLNITAELEGETHTFDYILRPDDPYGYAPKLREILETGDHETLPAEPTTPEEIETQFTKGVQGHIDSIASSLGYDNIDSIAKYLVLGNPFYDECSLLSNWTAAVWLKAREIKLQVESGVLEIPSFTELVDMLPVYPSLE